jgi:hypothetical protein
MHGMIVRAAIGTTVIAKGIVTKYIVAIATAVRVVAVVANVVRMPGVTDLVRSAVRRSKAIAISGHGRLLLWLLRPKQRHKRLPLHKHPSLHNRRTSLALIGRIGLKARQAMRIARDVVTDRAAHVVAVADAAVAVAVVAMNHQAHRDLRVTKSRKANRRSVLSNLRTIPLLPHRLPSHRVRSAVLLLHRPSRNAVSNWRRHR